jgi:hypothetical protein
VKTAWATLLAAVLVFCGGCVTRPDWIQATLVTADVTGVWTGRGTGRTRGGRPTFNLHQEGPKVTGTVSFSASPVFAAPGLLEGRVGGDVFHFSVRSEQGIWTGEFTVGDGEMEGVVTWWNGDRFGLLLRRTSPARAPTSN